MTTLSWPTLSRDPMMQRWNLIASTQVATSPLNGATQTQALPGMLWATTLEYSLLGDDARKMEAFLLSMQGRAGRVFVGNFGQYKPRGTAAGTPLVNGFPYLAGATSIGTDGWTPGVTMLAGDYFGVANRLHMVTVDATANGSGQMTLQFVPPLLATLADNAAITIERPTTTMMLLDDRQGWSYAPGVVRSYVVDLIEAI
jgi:hypothetical protein